MRIWSIWVRGDGATWLEAAWEDEQTAENPTGWHDEVERVRKLTHENRWVMRIITLRLPDRQIYEAFEIPVVETAVEE